MKYELRIKPYDGEIGPENEARIIRTEKQNYICKLVTGEVVSTKEIFAAAKGLVKLLLDSEPGLVRNKKEFTVEIHG